MGDGRTTTSRTTAGRRTRSRGARLQRRGQQAGRLFNSKGTAGGKPAPLWQAKPAKETCHSTKRTHFVFGYFSAYHSYREKLTQFAVSFANGFVFQNEPIWGRFLRGVH